MKRLYTLLIAAIAFSGSSQAVLIDFNTAGDLTNNFNEVTASGDARGSGKFTESSGNGIGGSDAVLAGTTGWGGQQVYNSAFAGDDSTLSVRIQFEYNPVAPEILSGGGAYVGFGANSTWNALFGNTGVTTDNQFMVALSGDNNTSNVRRLIHYNVADGVRVQTTGASVTLTPGSWYQLSLTASNNGDSTYDIASSLNHVNAMTGVVGSEVTSNLTDDFTNGDFAAGDDAYAFFGGQASTDNRVGVNFDNFEAIPEPSTLLLLGMALGTLWISRRRR